MNNDEASVGNNGWLAEAVRVTMFLTKHVEPDATFYKKIFGRDPEATQTPAPGRRVDGAKWKDRGYAFIDWNGARLECRLVPFPPAQLDQSVPSLGEQEAIFSQFQPIAVKVLNSASALHRIAFGAVCLKLTPTVASATKLLADKLRSVTFEDEARDFMYRINRPRTLDGMRINRINHWSLLQILNLDIPIAPPEQARARTIGSSVGVRLELDMNTDAESTKPIPKAKRRDVLDELVRFGREIVVEGDTP